MVYIFAELDVLNGIAQGHDNRKYNVDKTLHHR